MANVVVEKPTSNKMGRAAALCTAQPSAGAIGSASAGPTRRRASAKPRTVQNDAAATAQRNTTSAFGTFAPSPCVPTQQLGRKRHDMKRLLDSRLAVIVRCRGKRGSGAAEARRASLRGGGFRTGGAGTPGL